MRGILVGRLGPTRGHHATQGRATCSVSDSQGLLEEKPLRFLLPVLPPGSSEHAEVTFTNLKAPLFFLLPFFSVQSTWHNSFSGYGCLDKHFS